MSNHSMQSFPFPIPYIVGGSGGGSSSGLLDNDTPARVKTALEFLAQITIKTLPRAAACDSSVEWGPITELTANEKAAQGAACSLLVKYFAGDLKPDGWEVQRKKAAEKGINPTGKPGTLMRCFGCAPEFSGDCYICEGKRSIMVYPTGS